MEGTMQQVNRLIIPLVLCFVLIPAAIAQEEAAAHQKLVQTALGKEEADLVIQGATVLNVHTATWSPGQDIVIRDQRIAWVGPANAWNGKPKNRINAFGLYAVPGFGESHKHIESTHLTPEFEAALTLPHGNTWTVEDSHEFGNVTGEHNVEFWLMARKAGSPLKIFPNLGSAIPPTPFEFTGGHYGSQEIFSNMRNPMVVGLGEVMDWPSVSNPGMPGYKRMWEIIQATWDSRGVVEGHGSQMYSAGEINAFAAAGLSSDHEVREGAEVLDKLNRGIFIELRPGNMENVLPFLVRMGLKDWSGLSVTTDDREPDVSLRDGTTDFDIRKAMEYGVPVEAAYQMATINSARHWRIDHLVGSITPGRFADVVLVRDPRKLDITHVFADGKLVARDGKLTAPIASVKYPDWATKTVNLGRKLSAADFAISATAGRATVTAALLEPSYFAPEYLKAELAVRDGLVQRDPAKGITKFAIVDRYHGTSGGVAKMFWQKVGPKSPDTAVACTVAHDHHNMWVLGSSDEAMALAANRLAEIQGGWVLVSAGKVIDEVAFEVGGLMSARSPEAVAKDLSDFWAAADTLQWFGNGRAGIQRQIFATLTCQPWKWVLVAPYKGCESGFVNVTTGECRPVIEVPR
jgi:adenine deaminase